MFVLDTTTRTLEVLLDAAPATSQLPVVVTYADVDFVGASPHTLSSSNTITNSTTAVTAVNAPASGVKRQVEQLVIRNDDTVTRVVKLRYNDNSTLRNILWPTLLTGETLQYTHADGLCTLATDGSKKVTWTAPSISQGGGLVQVNANGSVTVSALASGTTFSSGNVKLSYLTAGSVVLVGTSGLLTQDTSTPFSYASGVLTSGNYHSVCPGSGTDNERFGSSALASNTTGANNLAFGAFAMLSNLDGVANTAVGASALQSCTSGRRNTGVSGTAIWQVTTGNDNVGIGYDTGGGATSGTALTTGGQNVLIGNYADTAAAGTTNGVALGYQAVCASNEVAFSPAITSMNLALAIWPRNHPGRKCLTANATNATATMSSLSDLSVTLVAGKKYTGTLRLIAKNSTGAEGLAVDFNGGGATMTSFHANLVGTPIGATVGVSDSTALGTAITCTVVATTDVVYEVNLTLVCNAGGSFIPRFAEVLHTSGTATVELGSYIWLEDSPN